MRLKELFFKSNTITDNKTIHRMFPLEPNGKKIRYIKYTQVSAFKNCSFVRVAILFKVKIYKMTKVSRNIGDMELKEKILTKNTPIVEIATSR